MSNIPPIPRKIGEPYVQRDGMCEARELEAAEIVIMSYVPQNLNVDEAVPFANRTISFPPDYESPEPPFSKSPREQFIRPFWPETKIASIDLDEAQTIAELLIEGGRMMKSGMGVSVGDAQMTVGIVAQEFARRRNSRTFELELELGSRIGPFSLGNYGVSPGVGLWVPVSKS